MRKFVSNYSSFELREVIRKTDHFCGLVVRVPGYRSRGLEFDSRRYQILRCNGSGMSSTQPHEYNCGARNSNGSGLETWKYGRGGSIAMTT
jgi:hypothetical protein